MTRVITYTLTLKEPCLLAAPGGDPNTESSLNYIPGGAFRGALAAAFLRDSDNHAKIFDSLFLNGRVRFLNAYPLLETRALPTPRAWTKLKDKGDCVYNRTENSQFKEAADEIPSGVGAEFVSFAPSVTSPRVDYEIAVHTARNRQKGRSIEGDADSALFRYRALARDQVFSAAIVIEDGIDTAQLEALLNEKSLLLGGSHTAGYGLTLVSDVKTPENWREVKSQPQPIPAGDGFIVYLSSHAILYHPGTGQPTADIRHFLPGGPTGYTIDKSFAAPTWVAGFNKHRGLPLTQQWAIQMGSTWVIKTDNPLTADQITNLEHKGIGARTEEGFGRLVINPQWPQQEFKIHDYSPPPQSKTKSEAPDKQPTPDHPLLRRMNERIIRAELDRRLAAKVNQLAAKNNVRGRLARSQLGRLQVRIRREAAKNNLNDFLAYLEATKKRKSADDQFRKFTVNGENFRDFLAELAGKPPDDDKEPKTVWDYLDQGRTPPSIGTEPIDFKTAELTHEYTIKFIANLCRQLSKLEVDQ